MKCVFVHEWDCNIPTEEVPLDGCRLCILARKVHVMEKRIVRKK